MIDGLDTAGGYGEFGNLAEVVEMEAMSYEEQKVHVKKLWQDDPVKYVEWKEYCVYLDLLPEFFGTHENPIPIDESKL